MRSVARFWSGSTDLNTTVGLGLGLPYMAALQVEPSGYLESQESQCLSISLVSSLERYLAYRTTAAVQELEHRTWMGLVFLIPSSGIQNTWRSDDQIILNV